MTIDQQIANIMNNATAIGTYLDKSIQAKTLLRRASKIAVTRMREKAPEDTGALSRSIGFISARRKKRSVMVGPIYGSGENAGNHAHLVEFGFIHKGGKRVEGQPFVLETYEETKGQILDNLRLEIKKEFDKAGKSIRGFNI